MCYACSSHIFLITALFCLLYREYNDYASEIEEPDWSVRQKQEEEEKRARQSLIADEFRKRRGSKPSTSSKVRHIENEHVISL